MEFEGVKMCYEGALSQVFDIIYSVRVVGRHCQTTVGDGDVMQSREKVKGMQNAD
jgi:hypothetical protein